MGVSIKEAEQDVRNGQTVVVLIGGLVAIALIVLLSWLFLRTRI
jgi:flagellar biogenesis protein FliO